MIIAASLPKPRSLTKRGPYPAAPEFLSHFDAVLIRAAIHTLAVPEHTRYVLDTRHAQHARAEVLLRRYRPSLVAVLAKGRFPHGPRFTSLLTDLPVVDLRTHPDDPDALWRSMRRFLLTSPAKNGVPHHQPHAGHPPIVDHPDLHGFYVPHQDVTDTAFFLRSWLPVLRAHRDPLVVLNVPPRDHHRALEAIQALRACAVAHR